MLCLAFFISSKGSVPRHIPYALSIHDVPSVDPPSRWPGDKHLGIDRQIYFCCHTNLTGSQKLLHEIGKLDCLVWQTGWFGFIDFGGSQGHRRRSNRQEPQQPKGLWRWLQDLIKEKNEKWKTRPKTRVKVNCIIFDCWLHQLTMANIFIGSRT
jgi:hypothetical protein